MKLGDNKILITGGSSGIGLAFAKKFLELGNRVIITGRNPDKLDRVQSENDGLVAIACDASNPEDIVDLARKIEEHHPDLNVLFNNAGVFLYKNLSTKPADLTALTSELMINVAGPIQTTAALVETLRRNRGTVVNVSSGLAFVPLQCAPVYCATKAAMHSYTLSLRQQLEDYGVEVVELMPPATKTPMTDGLESDAFKMMTTDELVRATCAGLQRGQSEIRPGQANQLHWMSRLAPGFIRGQLAKASKPMIPPAN